MKNSIFILILLTLVLIQTVPAQSLPAKVKLFLKANYPGWEISKGCFSDPAIKSKSFVSGDFNGDRKIDHAVAINKGGRSYTLALISTAKGFKAFNLKAIDLGDSTPLANLGVNKKGESVSGVRDETDISLRLKTDAIIIAECDANSEIFYWEKGRFVSLQLQ